MDGEYSAVLAEIKELLKVLSEGQVQLIRSIRELREEQKKLYHELKENNSTTNNVAVRTAMIN